MQQQQESAQFSIKDIQLNKRDPRGFMVTDIFWCTEDYVIVKAGGRVSPMFSDNPELCKEQRLRYMQLGQSLARINSLEPGRVIQRRNPLWRDILKFLHIGKQQQTAKDKTSSWQESHANSRDYFSREIARAIALCLEDMVDEGKKILDELERKVINLRQNEYRMLYLLSCFCLMVVYVGLVIYMTYHPSTTPGKNYLDLFVHDNTVPLRATLMGALAGFFSVSLGIRELNFDLDARYYLIMSYGFMRLFVAIIASLFIYYAIASGMVFSNLQETSMSSHATLYVLAFLSGFSEHFVPNVLRQIELKQEKAKDQSSPSLNN